MDPEFAKITGRLQSKLDELLAMEPLRHGRIPKTLPERGVYSVCQPAVWTSAKRWT